MSAPFDLHQSLAGLLLGLAGVAVIALYTRVNRSARRMGAAAHWWLGSVVGTSGMLVMGAGWALLCRSGPRVDLGILSFVGLVFCIAAFVLYAASARWVGRWRAFSSYSLKLETKGIYRHLRHPQALALCILPVGLGLLSGSIPYLATVPVWIASWTAYTFLEERNELLPAFGEEYLRYRATTPRLIPCVLRPCSRRSRGR